MVNIPLKSHYWHLFIHRNPNSCQLMQDVFHAQYTLDKNYCCSNYEYLRAAAPAADPGRIGKEAKQIGIKTLRCFAP